MDVAECEEFAEKYVSESNAGEKVAGQTAMGGAIGAAGGAVGGAIAGNVGLWAAIGAAVGTATPSKKSPLTQEEKKDEKRES